MERVVVLEIRDTNGNCRERHRLDHFPAGVGRAYTNDVILEDAEVCPQHLRIERTDADELLIKDLGSLNGTIDLKTGAKISQVAFQAELSVRVGETLLHFIDSQTPVSPAVPAHHRSRRRSSMVVVGIFAFLLTIGVDYLSNFYFADGWRQSGLGKGIVLWIVGSHFAFAFIWVALWGLVSKIFGRRARLANHLCIYASALLIWRACGLLLSEVTFLLSNDRLESFPATITLFALLFWMMREHLRLGTQLSKRRRSAVAFFLVTPLCAVYGGSYYVLNTRFSPVFAEQLGILPPPIPHPAGVSAEAAVHVLSDIDALLAAEVESSATTAAKTATESSD